MRRHPTFAICTLILCLGMIVGCETRKTFAPTGGQAMLSADLPASAVERIELYQVRPTKPNPPIAVFVDRGMIRTIVMDMQSTQPRVWPEEIPYPYTWMTHWFVIVPHGASSDEYIKVRFYDKKNWLVRHFVAVSATTAIVDAIQQAQEHQLE